MITFIIDDLSQCLIEANTGDIVETEVLRVTRKSFLQKFNKTTGWYVNWSKFGPEVEIYALVIKGTVSVEGLVAIEKVPEQQAVHIRWGCTAPHNNIWANGTQRYKGVGGHLFAIAGQKSLEYGFGGFVYGEAADRELFEYYTDPERDIKASPFPWGMPRHEYRIAVDEEAMKRIMEVYTYEYSDDTL